MKKKIINILKMKNFFFILFFYLLQENITYSCPICTATMIASFTIGKILHINIFFIGFLLSAIAVSSNDWLSYLYQKHIYNKLLNKIKKDFDNMKIQKLLIFKLNISKYAIILFLYVFNYYFLINLSFAIEKQYIFKQYLFIIGLFAGFAVSNIIIMFHNFLKKNNKNFIKFQKTIFLLCGFLFTVIIFKIFFQSFLNLNNQIDTPYKEITLTKEEKGIKKNNHFAFIITGLSASGKTTAAEKLIKEIKINKTISHTTRAIRPGEVNGIDYFFISKDSFQKMIKNNDFLEYSEHFNNFYGTSKSQINCLKDNDLIFVINEKGALELSKIPNINYVIIYLDISKEKMTERILKRDKSINKNELAKRLQEKDNLKILQKNKIQNLYKINTSNITEEEVYEKIKKIYLENKEKFQNN